MGEKEFFKPVPFINRLEEQKYINDYLTDTPTSILFLYGPKSTGKTTLINKVIKELDQKKYFYHILNIFYKKNLIILILGLFSKLEKFISCFYLCIK